jgi:integrase
VFGPARNRLFQVLSSRRVLPLSLPVGDRPGHSRDTKDIFTMATLDKKPRLKTAIRKKPYFETIAPGVSLGYRRNQGAGAWLVRAADGKGGNWTKGFAVADDVETSNQKTVLTYAEARLEAGKLARATGTSTSDDNGRPVTMSEAIDRYETDLTLRGANKHNACQLRSYLTPKLASKPVAMLVDSDLRNWRNDLVLVHGLKAASADRHGRSMKAALTLAAKADKRITNGSEWRHGLTKLPEQESGARNVILGDDVVQAAMRTAFDVDCMLGVWCQVLSETGNRESQIKRIEVIDLQAARLLVPSSRKGKNRQITRKALPITPELVAHLVKLAAGKKPHDRLLPAFTDLAEKFRPVAKLLNLGPEITPYAFRHSSIVRMLLKGIATRLVASAHDTSVVEIERTYSRYIVSDQTESILRDSLLRTPPAKLKLVA